MAKFKVPMLLLSLLALAGWTLSRQSAPETPAAFVMSVKEPPAAALVTALQTPADPVQSALPKAAVETLAQVHEASVPRPSLEEVRHETLNALALQAEPISANDVKIGPTGVATAIRIPATKSQPAMSSPDLVSLPAGVTNTTVSANGIRTVTDMAVTPSDTAPTPQVNSAPPATETLVTGGVATQLR